MSAGGDDAALIHNHDACDKVEECSIQNMADDEHRPVFGKFLEHRVNDFFALRIHCRSRFIQNQNCRVSENRTGQCNTLALTAGKLSTLVTDHRVKAVRQLTNEPGSLGLVGGIQHHFASGRRVSVSNVFKNRVVKQQRVLRHKPHLAPQIVRTQFANVHAID